ncbi:phage head-tail adapter protein [Pseudomonas oryzihabitans]|nr:phage head-tail adapter protein [Pseudomonas psychrotolerans]
MTPGSGLFAGMPREQLQKMLTRAQQDYADISSGAKVESASYTQGDGTRSVTYTRTNLAQLVNLIQMLQQQLGIVARPRRPLRPVFR